MSPNATDGRSDRRPSHPIALWIPLFVVAPSLLNTLGRTTSRETFLAVSAGYVSVLITVLAAQRLHTGRFWVGVTMLAFGTASTALFVFFAYQAYVH
jgi:hypothetical protein